MCDRMVLPPLLRLGMQCLVIGRKMKYVRRVYLSFQPSKSRIHKALYSKMSRLIYKW